MPFPGETRVPPSHAMTFGDAIDKFGYLGGLTKRKIQILRPPAALSRNTYSAALSPPLGPAYLASALEAAGYCAEILDCVGSDIGNIRPSDCGRFNIQGMDFEDILDQIDPNCIALGVSMMFSQEWPVHRELLSRIKERFPELFIVVGGEHPTALVEFVLTDCGAIDAVVMGEGEITFLEVVYRLSCGDPLAAVPGLAVRSEEGVVVKNGLSRRIRNIDEIPRPAWHLCDLQPYLQGFWTMGIGGRKSMPILATRGCPYQCTFCSNPNMWTTRYVMRSPEDVVDEIADLAEQYGVVNIDFYDLTAVVKRQWILAFCAELKHRMLGITWQLPSGTRSEALDDEVLRELKLTGCSFLVYSPESGSQVVLNDIKKHLNLQSIKESIGSATKIGHRTKVNFVIGFPSEKRLDLFHSLRFAWTLAVQGVLDCNFSIYTPYPGSELFERLREEAQIDVTTDAYFLTLLQQFDLTLSTSFNSRINNRELAAYRFLGMAGFYLLAYSLHPRRLGNLIKTVLRRTVQPGNLLEQRIMDWKARRRIVAKKARFPSKENIAQKSA